MSAIYDRRSIRKFKSKPIEKQLFCYDSPIGSITLASNGKALTGLGFCRQTGFANVSDIVLPVFRQTIRWLDIYFGGEIPDYAPPISLHTTDFRKSVYDILLTIPYGQTMTYGEIADIIAERQGKKRMSAQAVGGAVGHNPIGIIIPCHRVIGADGGLTGYSGGLDRKLFLLKLEGNIL